MGQTPVKNEMVKSSIVGTPSERRVISIVEKIREQYKSTNSEQELIVQLNNDDLMEIIRGVIGFEHHYPTEIKGNGQDVRIKFSKYQ